MIDIDKGNMVWLYYYDYGIIALLTWMLIMYQLIMIVVVKCIMYMFYYYIYQKYS